MDNPVLVSSSPGIFVQSLSEMAYWDRLFGNELTDIVDGGLESKQFGLVFLVARSLLWRSVDRFLASHELFPISRKESAATKDRVSLLVSLLGENSAVVSHLLALDRANPISDGEVAEYAEECIQFCRSSLGISEVPTNKARGDWFIRVAREVGGLSEFIDVQSRLRRLRSVGDIDDDDV